MMIFLAFVNYKVDELSRYTSLFGDDVKMLKKAGDIDDCQKSKKDNKIYEWTTTKKCKVMEIRKGFKYLSWS